MAPLPGWRPIKGSKGSARRYYSVSGHRSISRRQYDNLRAKNAGWQNVSQMQRATSAKSGNRPKWDKWKATIRANDPNADVSAYSRLRFDAWDVDRRRSALGGRDVLGNYRDSDDPELTAADGPLARLLAAIGARPMTQYDIGDSP